MFVTVHSAFVLGIDGVGVNVEVDLASGLPQTILVGLPDSTIRESVERVRTAIKNAGHRFPLERITINLAPADLKKDGTGFDLAIAVAILIASKQLENFSLTKTLIVGELALSGEIRKTRGVLAILEYAKKHHFTHVILPQENEHEAALITDLSIGLISHLSELQQLTFTASERLNSGTKESHSHSHFYGDISDINGQHGAKRALLIAAAGKHNIAVMGPPGVGKTMLIRRLPSILPPLTETEALEVTKINSLVVSTKATTSLIQIPPFRQPHHTISSAGLIGGGNPARPGEISLSHLGVLFLDEFTEFPRHIIELLRQPLEERLVTISRARAAYQFPAHFILAVSFNPCPCGLFGYDDEEQQCKCSTLTIQKYRMKLSGPILDRIDLQIEMARPSLNANLSSMQSTSLDFQQTVMMARQLQLKRNQKYGFKYNSDLSGKHLKQMCKLSSEAERLLQFAYEQFRMSYRGYDKIIKIARTIADLTQSETIKSEHISEAISYRNGDLHLNL